MTLIQNLISETYSEDKVIQRMCIFEIVRDYIYQINNAITPEITLACKEWYCVSKHKLLKVIYEELWYRTELCFIPFTFDMTYLPNHLQNWGLAKKNDIILF